MGIDYTASTFLGFTWSRFGGPMPEILYGYDPDDPQVSECPEADRVTATLEKYHSELRRFGNHYSGKRDLALVHCSSYTSIGRPGVTTEPVPEGDPKWREDLAALAVELGFPPELKPGRHLAFDIW